MRSQLALLAFVAVATASPFPQGVTQAIAPPQSAPSGCQISFNGKFGVSVQNISHAPVDEINGIAPKKQAPAPSEETKLDVGAGVAKNNKELANAAAPAAPATFPAPSAAPTVLAAPADGDLFVITQIGDGQIQAPTAGGYPKAAQPSLAPAPAPAPPAPAPPAPAPPAPAPVPPAPEPSPEPPIIAAPAAESPTLTLQITQTLSPVPVTVSSTSETPAPPPPSPAPPAPAPPSPSPAPPAPSPEPQTPAPPPPSPTPEAPPPAPTTTPEPTTTLHLTSTITKTVRKVTTMSSMAGMSTMVMKRQTAPAPPAAPAAMQKACKSKGSLELSLDNGLLKDARGWTGYIASNYQFQFDNPPQAGSIYTAGWSLCSNGSLALGGNAVFYQCRSGDFYNLYDRDWAPQCNPITIQAIEFEDC